MIHYIAEDLFESTAEALVNAVNTQGIMGKGIANEFKKRYPKNFKKYFHECKHNGFSIGQVCWTQENGKTIINFPTKTDYWLPSELLYIERGLVALKDLIVERQIASIAIPLLGTGEDKLQKTDVIALIEKHLADLKCEIYLYMR